MSHKQNDIYNEQRHEARMEKGKDNMETKTTNQTPIPSSLNEAYINLTELNLKTSSAYFNLKDRYEELLVELKRLYNVSNECMRTGVNEKHATELSIACANSRAVIAKAEGRAQ